MRQAIKEFVALAAETLPIMEPIYEFGALQVPGQEGFSNLRPMFPGREYVGADMRDGPGVDRVLDLHQLDLAPESVGTVLCLDTLEHVEFPRRALTEMHRVVRPGGLVVISSVMNFPIHDFPFDYWRFTPEAFRSILGPFAGSFVGYAGEESFPHTVVGIGFKGAAPDLSAFHAGYGRWQTRQFRQVSGTPLERLAHQLLPPILLPLVFQTYRRARALVAGRKDRP